MNMRDALFASAFANKRGGGSGSTYTKEEIDDLLAGKADTDSLAAVATSGDYSDLENLPEPVDLSPYALLKMIAPEYDSTATYADGDLFTFEGELYRVDTVNGQYISSDNLITADVMTTAGGFINGKIPKYSSGAYSPEQFNERWDYRTSGYIEVIPGRTYAVDTGGSYSSGNASNCDSFYNADKTRIGVYNPGDGVSNHITRQFTVPSGVSYVRLGLGPANYQPNPSFKMIRADMPRVIKTIIANELKRS